jgi:hypothetical protein
MRSYYKKRAKTTSGPHNVMRSSKLGKRKIKKKRKLTIEVFYRNFQKLHSIIFSMAVIFCRVHTLGFAIAIIFCRVCTLGFVMAIAFCRVHTLRFATAVAFCRVHTLGFVMAVVFCRVRTLGLVMEISILFNILIFYRPGKMRQKKTRIIP